MHRVTDEHGILLAVRERGPELWRVVKSVGAVFDAFLGLALVFGIEDIGMRKLAILDVTTKFDLAGTVGRRLERKALIGNGDMGIQKLAHSQAGSIDGLDLIENATASILKSGAGVDQGGGGEQVAGW